MRKVATIGLAVLTLDVASAEQKKIEFKTCSEAYSACWHEPNLRNECETERQWCLQTGTFANPKTKAVYMGLRKK
jgi:hypothetical protein